MKAGTKRRGCLSMLLVLIAVVAGLWWLIQDTSMKSASEVAPAIIPFVGDPDLMVREIRTQKIGAMRISQYSAALESGDVISFDIDQSGNLSGFQRQNQKSTSVVYTQESARQAALEFAQNQTDDSQLLSLAPEYSMLVESVSLHKYYEFVWIEKDRESGAFLPHSVKVQVNTQTGQVDGYARTHQSVTVSTKPNIGKQQAEQEALNSIEPYLSNAKISQTYLIIVSLPLYDRDAAQYLAWHIVVQGEEDEIGYVPESDIFIDALTGELLAIEPRS